MTPSNLYTITAFLLALFWRTSTGIPVPAPGNPDKCATLLSLSKALLMNKSELLNNNLFHGFNCSDMNIEMYDKTQTALACAPKGTSCSVGRVTTFSENECLSNITVDLEYYSTELKFQQQENRELFENNPKAQAALNTILELLQKNTPTSSRPVETPAHAKSSCSLDSDTFCRRMSLCKHLRGFQARVITIIRATGYMSSGDHKK